MTASTLHPRKIDNVSVTVQEFQRDDGRTEFYVWESDEVSGDYNYQVVNALSDMLSDTPFDAMPTDEQIRALLPDVTNHQFTVTISGCTTQQAKRVMTERLGCDDDYGFEYELSWE